MGGLTNRCRQQSHGPFLDLIADTIEVVVYCPICDEVQDTTVLTSPKASEDAANVKMLAHLRLRHPEQVGGDETQNPV